MAGPVWASSELRASKRLLSTSEDWDDNDDDDEKEKDDDADANDDDDAYGDDGNGLGVGVLLGDEDKEVLLDSFG